MGTLICDKGSKPICLTEGNEAVEINATQVSCVDMNPHPEWRVAGSGCAPACTAVAGECHTKKQDRNIEIDSNGLK